jgi:two-component system, response regulator RegA
MPARHVSKRGVLIVDDDRVFAQVLARALGTRGFATRIAHDTAQALASCGNEAPQHVVLDLKLGADSGLALIPELRTLVPGVRILLLTGYASLATAVEAIKRGADNYLAKPVDADAVAAALLGPDDSSMENIAPLRDSPQPLRRLEWEQIQRVLASCDGNVSAASRQLGIHRRTLQRKLIKRPVREVS